MQTAKEPTRENKGKEPLWVITRAQSKLAQENATKTKGSQTPREHTVKPKQKQEKTATGPAISNPILEDATVSERPMSEERSEEQLLKEGEPNLGEKSSSSRETDLGGSVLVDKINETFDSILKTYEKHLMVDTAIPPKLKEYPSPIQEKVNLVKHHALIRDTQTMLEGTPSYSVGKLLMHAPDLKVIHEDSEKGTEINIENELEERSVVEIIPPLQNKNARELWEEVRNFKDKDVNSLA